MRFRFMFRAQEHSRQLALRSLRFSLSAGFCVSCLCNVSNAAPQNATADICDLATVQAAKKSGVPVDVLQSISRLETGRQVDHAIVPWPWTVNMEGTGKWFATEHAARAFVLERLQLGARSFDVGCFQLNYRWHGQAFTSVEEMFDPVKNATYAASFLKRLHNETGDWSLAAGTYHSRTPELAARYKAKFESIYRQRSGKMHVSAMSLKNEAGHEAHDGHLYPMVIPSARAPDLGSLVPLTNDRRNALILLDSQRRGF